MFFLFKLFANSKKIAQKKNCIFRVFIKQAFTLADQIGNVGAVFSIIFIPAPIEQFPVVLNCFACHQHHQIPLLGQPVGHGFMVVAGGLNTEDNFLQLVLSHERVDLFDKPAITDKIIAKNQPAP